MVCIHDNPKERPASICLVDGLNAGAEDFRDVSAAVDRAGGDGGNKGIDALADNHRQGKINQEDLYQHRRTADDIDVANRDNPQDLNARQAADAGDQPRIKPKATAIAVISIVTAAPVSSKGKESIIRTKTK